MTLDQAIRKAPGTTRAAVQYKLNKQYQKALDVLLPIADTIYAELPPGPDSALCFLTDAELGLYLHLYGNEHVDKTMLLPVHTIFYLMGSVYLDLRDPVKASYALSTSIDYDPVSVQAFFEYSECFKLTFDWEHYEAVSRNAFAITMEPAYLARAYRNMAYVLSETGRYADAAVMAHLAACYDRHATGSDSPRTQEELEFIQQRTGRTFPKPSAKQAAAACRRANVPFGPAPQVWSYLKDEIQKHVSAGEPEKAKPFTSLLTNLFPGQRLDNILEGRVSAPI